MDDDSVDLEVGKELEEELRLLSTPGFIDSVPLDRSSDSNESKDIEVVKCKKKKKKKRNALNSGFFINNNNNTKIKCIER